MTYRQFPSHIEDLAQQCFSNPIVDANLTILSPPTATADGAFRVEVEGVDVVAFAKPSRPHDRASFTVAHEKLVSDLAFLLGLPVPPVQIVRNTSKEGLPPSLALSYVVFPTPRNFRDRHDAFIVEEQWRPFQRVASAMRVLYSWVKDEDHAGHEENIIFGRSPTDDSLGMAFIDHSYALTHNGGYAPRLMPPVHGIFVNDDYEAVDGMIQRVLNLEEARIVESVCRLGEFFGTQTAAELAAQLCSARQVLGSIFGRD